jgi:hypothetical protein
MNQEDFKTILTDKHYSFKIVGDTIVVDHYEHVTLGDLTTLPDHITFKNNGYVSLSGVTELPENVKFENNGEVYLKTGLYMHGHYRHPGK